MALVLLLCLLLLLLLLGQNYMYAMTFGNYQWYNNNTYALLRKKSVNATLNKYGGNYTGWFFLQVNTFTCDL